MNLVNLAKLPENPVSGVYYASSLLPHKDLYNHMALYDATGKRSKNRPISSTGTLDLTVLTPGPGLFSKDGLTENNVLKGWFMLACGEYQALPQLVTHAKTTSTSGEQAKLLVGRVDAWIAEQVKKIEDQSFLNLQGLQDAERLCAILETIPARRDTLKAVQSKMQASAKEESLKAEVLARVAYQKVLPMLLTKRKPETENAKSYFEQISKRFPDTEYGRRSSNAISTITIESLTVTP